MNIISTMRPERISARYLILFSVLLLALMPGALMADYAHAQAGLPTVQLDQTTIDCLKNRDWKCSLDRLISLYYEQGADSNFKRYIGYVYQEQAREALGAQNLQRAAELLEQAVSWDEENVNLLGDLGFVYLQLSQYDKARETLLQAVELDSANPRLYAYLGRISYLTGANDEAIAYYAKSLALNPDNPSLREQLARLERQQSSTKNGTVERSHVFRITFDEGMDRNIYNEVWRMLEESWYETGTALDLWPKRQIPVLLLTKKKFAAITDAPIWAGGLYEGQIKIPVADFQADRLRDTIHHEYLHALIYDTMANRCPWWLNEGLAQYFQKDEQFKQRQLALAKTVLSKLSPRQQPDPASLPGQISTPEQAEVAYALAYSAVTTLIERFTIVPVRSVLFAMGKGASFEQALEDETGFSYQEFVDYWHTAVRD